MMESFYAQFEHPKGPMGWLVGLLLAIKSRERNEWAVSLLKLRPNDSVLEIGFGPGTAIEQVAQAARFVAGLDHSSVMVQQASRHNAAAIRAGRVELRQGTAETLPWAAATFDKVFAVNSLHQWPDKPAALAGVQRVLKPEGVFMAFEQPFRGGAQTAEQDVLRWLTDAGFHEVKTVAREMKPTPIVCVQGTR